MNDYIFGGCVTATYASYSMPSMTTGTLAAMKLLKNSSYDSSSARRRATGAPLQRS